MNRNTPTIFITMGDYNGIGPEVIIKAVHQQSLREDAEIVIVGHRENFAFYCDQGFPEIRDYDDEGPRDAIAFLDVDHPEIGPPQPGVMQPAAGMASIKFLDEAISRTQKQPKSALVTAPICKEGIWLAGHRYSGHTELLAARCQTDQVTMMLLTEGLRVGLVTTHHPLKAVPALLTEDLIVEKTRIVYEALRQEFEIAKPRIALTALNPHGGENGMLGYEERDIIKPAITRMQKMSWQIEGPFPADTLFVPGNLQAFDACMAMYHDQGMIPVKLIGFGKGINFTAGLPIIRTSPDHGTAFDIAGRGLANAASMREAIRLAIELAKKRPH